VGLSIEVAERSAEVVFALHDQSAHDSVGSAAIPTPAPTIDH
jgi:hypothetical protein